MTNQTNRRRFLKQSTAGLLGAGLAMSTRETGSQEPGERPEQSPEVHVLNPRDRVPLSFIIDDSTCLVNLAYFGIPHFHAVFPDRYQQNWRELPREIPDSFVRKFGEWCAEREIKGKYSIVPYPACVGWIDRDMPGWSVKELRESLDLVRTLMLPNWDIHPEMVSHTWVINTKTGRPYPERSEDFMENWRWTDGKSVDQLADYLSYALCLLHNVDLPCEGITTPGGFGNRVLPELSQATHQACRDVFQAEIPHYFRHLFTDERSVAPRVEYASGLDRSDPQCCVSIIGCTGDWFGGWDGLTPGSVDRLITEDLEGGRMPEVIDRGEPAIMVCHWPGIYFNGQETGFKIFQEAVRRIHERNQNVLWMKLSEIARYWAAKELTRITRNKTTVHLHAPFASPIFTLEIELDRTLVPKLVEGNKHTSLREVSNPLHLQSGTWLRHEGKVVVCFDLPKGHSIIEFA